MTEQELKSEEIGATGPLDPLQLEPGLQPDRLPPMLFLSALVHGVLIIGITFNAVIPDALSKAVSLEVTIVADPDNPFERLDDAAYLAQASQRGGGNTDEQSRPSAPLESSVPVDNAGNEDGDGLKDSIVQKIFADEVLVTASDQDSSTKSDPREEPTPIDSRAALLQAGAEASLPLPQDLRANFLVRDKNKQRILVSADTRESNIAGYVDRWKRKIEAVGGRYLPEQSALQGLTGSPTLEVTITASGQLSEVIIRESSGSKLLDQAALNILRRAAPFDPFPEAVRLDHPELNFVYKWRFADVNVHTTASNN
jgi:protein TonB